MYEAQRIESTSRRHAFTERGFFKPGSSLDHFDSKMLRRIGKARTPQDWEKIVDDLLEAHARSKYNWNGLRYEVLKHFVKYCPAEFKKRYYKTLGPARERIRTDALLPAY